MQTSEEYQSLFGDLFVCVFACAKTSSQQIYRIYTELEQSKAVSFREPALVAVKIESDGSFEKILKKNWALFWKIIKVLKTK